MHEKDRIYDMVDNISLDLVFWYLSSIVFEYVSGFADV